MSHPATPPTRHRPRRSPLALLLPVIAAPLLTGCAHGPSFSPTQTTLITPQVSVPMTVSPGGLAEVDAVINGQHVRSAIDTGSFATLIAPSFTQRAALRVHPPTIQVEDAGGNRHTRVVYSVPSCAIGKATLTDFVAVESELRPIARFSAASLTSSLASSLTAAAAGTASRAATTPPATRPPELVLSPALFHNLLWTIDFPNRRMTLEEGSLPPPDGVEILPMQFSASGHILIPASVGGQQVWAMMDTGFTGGLAVPSWALPAFTADPKADTLAAGDVQFYYGNATLALARLHNDVSLGRHVIERPLYIARVGKDVTIGAEYLRYFTITIDQRNQRVRLHRTATAPIQSPSPTVLAMYLRRQDGAVTGVREGGTAQRAGVHVGDRVTSIDHVPYADFVAGKRPKRPVHPGYVSFEILPRHSTHPLTVDIPYSEIYPTPTPSHPNTP